MFESKKILNCIYSWIGSITFNLFYSYFKNKYIEQITKSKLYNQCLQKGLFPIFFLLTYLIKDKTLKIATILLSMLWLIFSIIFLNKSNEIKQTEITIEDLWLYYWFSPLQGFYYYFSWINLSKLFIDNPYWTISWVYVSGMIVTEINDVILELYRFTIYSYWLYCYFILTGLSLLLSLYIEKKEQEFNQWIQCSFIELDNLVQINSDHEICVDEQMNEPFLKQLTKVILREKNRFFYLLIITVPSLVIWINLNNQSVTLFYKDNENPIKNIWLPHNEMVKGSLFLWIIYNGFFADRVRFYSIIIFNFFWYCILIIALKKLDDFEISLYLYNKLITVENAIILTFLLQITRKKKYAIWIYGLVNALPGIYNYLIWFYDEKHLEVVVIIFCLIACFFISDHEIITH